MPIVARHRGRVRHTSATSAKCRTHRLQRNGSDECAFVGSATWKSAHANTASTVSTQAVLCAAAHGSPPAENQWENIAPPAKDPTRIAVMLNISM